LPGTTAAAKVKGELKLGVGWLAWQVKVTDEYAEWFTALIKEDLGSATLVAQAVAALLLLGGDKAGNWERWYRDNVPAAERLYLEYTTEGEQ
jgi:hypothetical protein